MSVGARQQLNKIKGGRRIQRSTSTSRQNSRGAAGKGESKKRRDLEGGYTRGDGGAALEGLLLSECAVWNNNLGWRFIYLLWPRNSGDQAKGPGRASGFAGDVGDGFAAQFNNLGCFVVSTVSGKKDDVWDWVSSHTMPFCFRMALLQRDPSPHARPFLYCHGRTRRSPLSFLAHPWQSSWQCLSLNSM